MASWFRKPAATMAAPKPASSFSLPNGRSRAEAYQLDLASPHPPFKPPALEAPAACGLNLAGARFESARPSEPGTSACSCAIYPGPKSRAVCAACSWPWCKDPKNLWKTLPSDPAGLFASADSQVQQQAGLLGASRQGPLPRPCRQLPR